MLHLPQVMRLVAVALLLSACGGGDDGKTEPATDAAKDIIDDDVPLNDAEIQEEEGDIELPWDLSDADLVESDPDVPDAVPGGFTDCPTLGVSPYWEGTWEGIVTYDLESDKPLKGLFLVNGTLSFEIQCLDQKLLVAGKLEGLAEAAGEVGQHPFAANIFGDFNYIERTIKADLLNGEVRLFKVISLFFKGNFDGAVTPTGTFEGEWDAVHTSNDLGLTGEASGYGDWKAYPAPKPEPEPEQP
jgi:hypothetical protein